MKLAKPVFWISAVLFCVAVAGAADSAERAFPGRFASPNLDASGRLSFLYQDSTGALRFGKEDSPDSGRIIRDGGGLRAPMFPRLKEDRSGALWATWVEGDGLMSEVILGRFKDDGLTSLSVVNTSSGTDLSPDLDFDSSNRVWIAWVHQSETSFRVYVKDPGSGRISMINPAGMASISSVRILAAGPAGAWVFWTGRDLGHDEIFCSRFDGDAWTPAARLNADNRVPHLFLDAVEDPSGRPWVAWSAFDGRGYKVCGSRWDGNSWSAEETLTLGMGSDAFPSLAFAGGDVPVLVWSRASGTKSALCAKLLGGPAPEKEILSFPNGSVTDIKLAGRDGKLAVLWQSGDGIRTRFLLREDLQAGKDGSGTAWPGRSGSSTVTGENMYIAFGDDNTYGVIDGGPAPDLGYVPRLQATIAANYGGAEVFNEGVIGESTVSGLGRIADVLASREARYLLLLEGTNDVVIPGISTDATAFNIEQMVRECLDARTLPVLATIVPRNDNFWNQMLFRKRLYAINDAITLIAVNLKIASVDIFNAFWDYPAADGGWTGLLSDGVHPNELGYDVISQAWWNEVRNLPFPPSGVAVQRSTERSLLMGRNLNYLTWSHSPKITNPFKFRSYRIYRRDLADATARYELIASIPYSPFHNPQKYNDLDIVETHRYEYVVTLLRIDGIEGPYSDPAAESD